MTEKNILSTFEKTSIVPFNPSKVLGKIILDPSKIPDLGRPLSSGSNQSTLSESDIIKIRAIFKVVVAENNNRMVRKLQRRMVSL